MTENVTSRVRVFISYAREDRAFVVPFASVLEQRGYRLWWDRSIEAGSAFRDEIERQIDQADWVVVLWSRASVKSEWVMDEAARAQDRSVLIPAAIDDSKPPLGFGRLNTVDLKQWNGDAQHPGFRAIEARLIQSNPDDPVADDADVASRGPGAVVHRNPISPEDELAAPSARRPRIWHCVYCGKQSPSYNDYHCVHCGSLRPYFPATATMRRCACCEEFNLVAAIFCEWCGTRIG